LWRDEGGNLVIETRCSQENVKRQRGMKSNEFRKLLRGGRKFRY